MSANSANGSTREWRKLRAKKLEANPTCEWWLEIETREFKERIGCDAPATDVDHIVPLKQWPGGRFVWSNLRSICDDHHKVRHGKQPKPTVDAATGLPTSNHWWSE